MDLPEALEDVGSGDASGVQVASPTTDPNAGSMAKEAAPVADAKAERHRRFNWAMSGIGYPIKPPPNYGNKLK